MDEIQTGGGAGVQGDVSTGGGPFAGRDSQRNAATVNNTVRVDTESLENIKDQIREIKQEQRELKRDFADLKEEQHDTKTAIGQMNTEVRAISVRVETALNRAQEKPVTLVQVVSAVLAVVFLILIVLLLGIWLGGLR